MTTRTILLSTLLLTASCAPGDTGGTTDPGTGDPDAKPTTRPDAGRTTPPPPAWPDAGPPEACGRMDILFVIDNSGSMMEEQENLATNFPMFIDVLNTFETEDGTPIDYRVALTSTSLNMSWSELFPGIPIPSSQSGDDGEMLMRCDMSERWLTREDPGIADTFACAAELGTNGADQEMPLRALNLALDDRVADGTNAGFLRDDALLAIVVLTDEDDCSREDDGFTLTFGDTFCGATEPVRRYASFLDNLTGAPGRWAIAVIAGTGPGQCDSDFGKAAEAHRLREVAELAGANGIMASICEGDLTTALNDALATFDLACENLPPPVD